MNNIYPKDPTPGDWSHRGSDCEAHGANIAFARVRGTLGKFYCVACLLEAAQVLKDQEK